MPITIEPVTPAELPDLIPTLSQLLMDAVEGATLGFISPVPYDEAHSYWMKIGPELRSGARVLLVARDDDRIVGAGQLAFAQSPNSRHRAEVQKLFVSSDMRGRGLGRQLMDALHAIARAHARSLILLSTRVGAPAEQFYRALGYREVGVVPGYAMGHAGERYDNVNFYLELA